MSSEIPQREEFVRENKFRVELPDTEQIEEIYDALSHTYQIEPGTFMVGFKIGTSHSEDELFSQINVNAIVVDNAPREGYSIDVNLNYQNPTYSYCPKEQVGQLQGLLTDGYGYSSIDRQTEKDQHSLIIREFDEAILYVLNLGSEDERTLWKGQVEGVDQMLKDTSHPYYELIKLGAEQARSRLVNNPHPIPTDSQIKIKPIDADPNRNGPEDLFTPIDWLIGGHEGIIRNFRDKPKKWVQFIEDAVNAMSQVKGIPQSGTLALLPPSEIPQS